MSVLRKHNWFAELMKNEWMNSISGFLDELKNEYHVVKLYLEKKNTNYHILNYDNLHLKK